MFLFNIQLSNEAHVNVDDNVEGLTKWNDVDVNQIEEDIFCFPIGEFVVLLAASEAAASVECG